jgi:hypothetical protein
MSLPLRLTDAELAQIQDACRPLLPGARHAFVLEVANALQGCSEIGPGTIGRIIRETQRRFFNPPLEEHVGKYGRR